MKKLLGIVALTLCFLCYFGSTAYAEGYERDNDCSFLETTSRQGHEHCYNDTDTDTNHHDHDRDNPVGGGVDFYLYKSDRFDVENQNKWDQHEYSNYTVVKIKTEKGVVQYVAEFLSRLFKRGE